ncbi:MAG: hypothetical protein EZS28_038557 [Streblomastix strix]|uniref:Uncharacterized protein n=1 Tax=Streblomastix strix TaxID=222440 RepID=A0A5J4U894_9EUKA|nr:MAG: hypothetical protein EZS28_038557 [Streblomastix strix]
MTERRAPILIRSQQDVELYKNYIESLIISIQERTLTDTKEKYIAIYSMCAITYLLPISGKSIPSIKLQQYIWAGPQGFNSATLILPIIPAPNDFYNQGSILQSDALMTWTIRCKCLCLK